MLSFLKKLGPGLLFAGAAIGVSHLVQSTRAGADFGFGLIWALLLVNLFKYPFFQYGPKYTLATGESILDGYNKLGKWVLILYFILTLATMFTIQTAVTVVTAGLAINLFGITDNVVTWSVIITFVCLLILVIGKYKLLDKFIKIIIVLLALSTIAGVAVAIPNTAASFSFTQIFPSGNLEIAFLIAFMGWMPAPLDISVWHSIWAIEKKKDESTFTPKSALLDFNIGYFGAIILGIAFVCLGYFVMFNTGETFSNKAAIFSNQGNWAYAIIGIAAFTTMFSTTITTLDASPRAMSRCLNILSKQPKNNGYLLWILILAIGTVFIFFVFASEMGLLVKIATILSFITAPFYAIINYMLISSKYTPKEWRPNLKLHILSWMGILFLIGFSIWYLTIL